MDMQAALTEYLAPVQGNPSLTNEHKDLIESWVRGFVSFVEAKHAIDNPPEEHKEPDVVAPVLEHEVAEPILPEHTGV